MAIYIKGDKPKTVKHLLTSLFSHRIGSSCLYGVETFNDKECKKSQCRASKIRSFEDVLECVQTYFPEVDHIQLVKKLFQLTILDNLTHNKYTITVFTCRDINRINMYFSTYGTLSYNAFSKIKYGSKYSWLELINLVGVDSNEKLNRLKSYGTIIEIN